jgi:hypothetical protein
MSLVDKKVASRYAERKIQGSAKLLLTRNILAQIDHLHEVVGGVEWSGVLVYRVVEGSIEDHKNLVVEVLEILPMDVGTSGYTEYELDSSDEYTFANLCDRVMMDDGLKIGHIHTHHNMGCFFSGTDTQELHDNAPNHNYYLSLIVNFKDPSNWCAKIALVGEESQSGSFVSKYKGTNGEMVEVRKDVDQTLDVLYTLEMDITEPVSDISLSDEFKERVAELNKSRGRSYGVWNGSSWQRDPETNIYARVPGWNVPAGKQASLFPEKQERSYGRSNVMEENRENANPQYARLKIDVSTLSIESFANKLLAQDTNTLATLLGTLNLTENALDVDSPTIEVDKQLYHDALETNFDIVFEEHFKTTPTRISREMVAKKLVDVLEKYVSSYVFLEDVIDEIKLNYILDED